MPRCFRDFDGMPDTWFTAGLAYKGPAYVSNVYTYPNTQEASTLWFHDHALGLTRQHVYSGLAGFYLIRDANDTGTATNSMGLPAGAYESELMIADRQFDISGQLYFPAGCPATAPDSTVARRIPIITPTGSRSSSATSSPSTASRGRSCTSSHAATACGFVNGSNARFYQMQLSPPTRPARRPAPPDRRSGRSASDGGFLNAATNLDLNPVPGSLARAGRARRRDRRLHRQDRQLRPDQRQRLRRPRERRQLRRVRAIPQRRSARPGDLGQVMMFKIDKTLVGTDTTFNPAPAGAAVRGGAGQPAAS